MGDAGGPIDLLKRDRAITVAGLLLLTVLSWLYLFRAPMPLAMARMDPVLSPHAEELPRAEASDHSGGMGEDEDALPP